ncbi:high affinity nerve growth factor receptor [Nephila pilipes]|uniref:High affinity nerve growth factor receptor n=1 Tax=Nephila pilipes TaxID=299642 RepID=A0A8X6Q0U1_NEPPI|nr:high affinity nerve growth factor receptor [Nephila pilipes]
MQIKTLLKIKIKKLLEIAIMNFLKSVGTQRSNQTAPNIEEMRVTKNFYWCIYYKVIGFPKPQRTWYFNNQPLQNPLIRDLENAWTMKNSYVADDILSCLQLERASQVNEGLYTLVASNSLGTVNYSIDAKFHKDPVLIAHPTYIPQGRIPPPISTIRKKPEVENKSKETILVNLFFLF